MAHRAGWRNKVFLRFFFAFLSTLLLAVFIFTALTVLFAREERKNAIEAELRLQARDVAQLMYQKRTQAIWPFDQALTDTLNWKLSQIRNNYDVDIWIVTSAGSVTVLGEGAYSDEQLNDPKLVEQFYKVLSGEEIRAQGLIPGLGGDTVTIGVPWRNEDDVPIGVVFLHIAGSELDVDFSDAIRNVTIAGLCALLVGAVVAFFVSRRETGPLRLINQAVTDFASGDLQRRVNIGGNDELSQLAQSFNKMAEDLANLEESRKSFVANVSHELRSPLTCIQGYVHGMLDGTISGDDQPKYLEVVLSETKRLTKLINELLDLSRFESGNFPLTIARFDINEVISVEMLKFENRIEEKRISVEIAFRERQTFVMADEARIRQVLTNLIDNAVKFLGENGELFISTHATDDLCYVSIRDDGVGIAPEDLPFVFDRFYKADKAHTSGMGTGLGLAIVKRIIDQHGQTVKVMSSGKGTTFTFTLPRAEE